MELLIVLLIGVTIWLWMQIARLSERVELVDRKLIDANDSIQALRRLALDAAPVTPPVARREPIVLERTPAPVAPAPAPVFVPTPPKRATPPPIEERASVVGGLPPSREASADHHSLGEGGQPAASIAAEAATPESWEITVGTSWFNKIGVLTLVIGVASLVAYSFDNIGPAGRIAIGYAISSTILGAGVWLERRDRFRNYAYGLIAGGWGGLYFTTFAMHDVPAAKIIESDIVAVSLLSTVAAGMIAHSLKYRSQVVTSLAFVVAYATLALSPLSVFSLAASVPLAFSVLIVSQRFGWAGVSALGIASTYGVFILRHQVFPTTGLDSFTRLDYAMLAAYWLTFEVADLIGLWSRRRLNVTGSKLSVSMLALNAVGVFGALLVSTPLGQPQRLATVLFSVGAAYVVSAIIRAWLMPERRLDPGSDRPFDGAHAATAVATAIFTLAIDLRFPTAQEGLGWLFEAEVLFVAGLTLSDRWLRRMASIVAALVTMHAGMAALFSRSGIEVLPGGVGTHATIAVIVAMIWYANREAIRSRGDGSAWLEPAYAWAGTALLVTAGWAALSPAHFTLAGWILALVLLEAGLRRDHEYTLQSYGIGAIAGYTTAIAFLTPAAADGTLRGWGIAPSSFDDWTVLPIGIAVCAGAAVRLVSFQGTKLAPAQTAAASIAATFAAALTMVFEWRVLPTDAVAPAWVATGVALLSIGLWRSVTALRWQGYALLALGAIRASGPVLGRPDAAGSAIAWLVACVIAIYVMALASRRFTRDSGETGTAQESEDIAITILLIGATGLLTGLIVTQLEASMITLVLALMGLGLMATGLAARERVLRVSGLTLLTGCLLKLFLYDLRELEPLPRIFSFVVFGLVLLAISWAYTRYREQIRKLL